MIDRLFTTLDSALRTVFTAHTGALMRVNHVGEVCGQALCTAQAFATSSEALREHFIRAGAEETNHLAWTEQRQTQWE